MPQKEQKEVYFRERDQRNQSFATLVEQFWQNVQETLSAIRTIVADAKLDDSGESCFNRRRAEREIGQAGTGRQQIGRVQTIALEVQQGQTTWCYWKHVHSNCNTALPTLCAMCSLLRTVASQLWAALCHYQQQEGNVDKSAPVDLLDEDQRVALTATDGKFHVSVYKALFLCRGSEAIKSGALNLLHSEKFRSLR